MCSVCEYESVLMGATSVLVHAADCPEAKPGDRVRCKNRLCRLLLDPERVERFGAERCDTPCRRAAWGQRVRYGRQDAPRPRKARSNGRKKPAGITLPWRRTVGTVAVGLLELRSLPATEEEAYADARRLLEPAASKKNRDRLAQEASS